MDKKKKTVNPIMSESSKLAPKDYSIRHKWVGKIIHWEMFKRLKLDHTTKMQKTESFWKNGDALKLSGILKNKLIP